MEKISGIAAVRMNELQVYALTQINLRNMILTGKKKQVIEEYIELCISLHEVQKQSK